MNMIQRILEDLQRGATPETLATIVPWESLTPQDLSELVKLARSKPDQKESYNILVYLFRISREKDLWFSVEVLSIAVQYLIMTPLDRQALLRTMRKRLDLIKDDIGAKLPNEQELRRYWLLEASFYAVNGSNLAETGHTYEAGQNYQIAKGIFEQLGLVQQAEQYKAILQKLKDPGAASPASATVTAAPTKPQAAIPPQATAQPAGRTVVPFAPVSVQSPPQIPQKAEKLPPPAAPASQPRLATPESVNQAKPPSQIDPAPVQLAAPVETITTQTPSPTPPAEAPKDEGTYRALPDVWVEEGRLHLPAGTQPETGSPEMLDQIHQQSEILAGIQLQVQMFLYRHSMLNHEVQALEKKAAALKQKVERLEKKAKDLGDTTPTMA